MTDSDKPAAGSGGDAPKKPAASPIPAAGSKPSEANKASAAAPTGRSGQDKTGKAEKPPPANKPTGAGQGKAGDAGPAAPPTLARSAAGKSDEKPAGKAADAAPSSRRHWSVRHVVTGVATALAVLAIAYISWPLWDSALPGWLHTVLAPVMDAGRTTATAKQLEALNTRVAALDTRLAGLEAKVSALGSQVAAMPRIEPSQFATADSVRALESRLAAVAAKPPAGDTKRLEARLEALEKQLSTAVARSGPETAAAIEALRAQSAGRMTGLERENDALRAMIADFNRRLAAVESKKPAPGPDRANALLLAVGQLREATRGAAPFAEALSAVEALSAGDPTLARPAAALKPHAARGVPDLGSLRTRFDALADEIARAAVAPAGQGWIDRTLAEISRLVTIRKVGEAAAGANDAQGLVARAELRLAAGDLAGAVAAVGALQGPPAKVAAPWLADARARLAVDKAVAELFAGALGAASKEQRG